MSHADNSHAYTANTVAKFLGWMEPAGKAQFKVMEALAALEHIERGVSCQTREPRRG